MPSSLASRLHLQRSDLISIVGAGGKTSLLFRLAEDLGGGVLLSTTTHLGAHQARASMRHIRVGPGAPDLLLLRQLHSPTIFSRECADPTRLAGFTPQEIDSIHQQLATDDTPMVIEADGARGFPLKAPAAHEPVIPSSSTMVCVSAGLSGLGLPMQSPHVHRPERFAELTGATPGEPVRWDHLLAELTSPQGGLKSIPSAAKRVACLNQADALPNWQEAIPAALSLLRVYHACAITSLQKQSAPIAVFEPLAGVILAAGGSRRMGRPKVLLEWEGEPLVRRAARTALEAGLNLVRVVAGEHAAEIEAALTGLPVELIHQPDWAKGQSASVQAGITGLPESAGAALFLMADQPFVTPALIQALWTAHAEEGAPLSAPRNQGQRTPPTLMARALFPELMRLSGDQGGRRLFDAHPCAWVDWPDARLAQDIDTPEDYAQWKPS